MKRIFTVIVSIGLLCSCGTSKGNSSQKTVTDESGSVSVNEGGIKENAPISENSSEEVIERPHYNPSATILTGLKHTKLEVDFMWDKSQMNGKATLTCSPHFYSTDSLILDAKAMEIHSVKLNGKDLNYKYNDAKFLRIKL